MGNNCKEPSTIADFKFFEEISNKANAAIQQIQTHLGDSELSRTTRPMAGRSCTLNGKPKLISRAVRPRRRALSYTPCRLILDEIVEHRIAMSIHEHFPSSALNSITISNTLINNMGNMRYIINIVNILTAITFTNSSLSAAGFRSTSQLSLINMIVV